MYAANLYSQYLRSSFMPKPSLCDDCAREQCGSRRTGVVFTTCPQYFTTRDVVINNQLLFGRKKHDKK